MNVIATIIARTNSRRLPKKVLEKIDGKPLISHLIGIVQQCQNIDSLYVATSWEDEDAILCEIAEQEGIKSFKGDPLSVIDRMIAVGVKENADYIIRVTGDNPLTDHFILDKLIKNTVEDNFDYGRAEGLPIGSTAEVIKFEALKECRRQIDPLESEYLMLFLYNPSMFDVLVLDFSTWVPENLTLTVDTSEDLIRTRFIQENAPAGLRSSLVEILDLHQKTPIPFIRYESNGEVKLPGGEKMTFADFKDQMEIRKNDSKSVVIVGKVEYLEWVV